MFDRVVMGSFLCFRHHLHPHALSSSFASHDIIIIMVAECVIRVIVGPTQLTQFGDATESPSRKGAKSQGNGRLERQLVFPPREPSEGECLAPSLSSFTLLAGFEIFISQGCRYYRLVGA